MATLQWATTGNVTGLQHDVQGNAIALALATDSQGTTAPTPTSTGLSATAGLVWHDTNANADKVRDQADTVWLIRGYYDETNKVWKPASDGPAATVRSHVWSTAGLSRWALNANATAEGGSNAGSDLELWSYTDAGAQLTKVLGVTRSDGTATFYGASLGISASGANAYLKIISSGGSGRIWGVASWTSGSLVFYDVTGGAQRLVINSDSSVNFQGPGYWSSLNGGYGYTGLTLDVPGVNPNRIGQGVAGGADSIFTQRDTSGNYLTFLFHAFDGSAPPAVGSISTTGTSVAFNTTSDYRLKTVHGPADASARIDAVPVHDATMGGVRRSYFLAHELAAAAPWAVTGEKDAVLVVGELRDARGAVLRKDIPQPETLGAGENWTKTGTIPAYQMVDHSALVPELWAEIRALRRRVAALEAHKA